MGQNRIPVQPISSSVENEASPMGADWETGARTDAPFPEEAPSVRPDRETVRQIWGVTEGLRSIGIGADDLGSGRSKRLGLLGAGVPRDGTDGKRAAPVGLNGTHQSPALHPVAPTTAMIFLSGRTIFMSK